MCDVFWHCCLHTLYSRLPTASGVRNPYAIAEQRPRDATCVSDTVDGGSRTSFRSIVVQQPEADPRVQARHEAYSWHLGAACVVHRLVARQYSGRVAVLRGIQWSSADIERHAAACSACTRSGGCELARASPVEGCGTIFTE